MSTNPEQKKEDLLNHVRILTGDNEIVDEAAILLSEDPNQDWGILTLWAEAERRYLEGIFGNFDDLAKQRTSAEPIVEIEDNEKEL